MAQEPLIPALRDDLVLLPGAPGLNGAPTWLIHDPLNHAFCQIDVEGYALVSAWRGATTASALKAAVARDTGADVDDAEIDALMRFADAHQLLDGPQGGWRGLARRAQAGRSNLAMWLIHNYLFFKIPLFRPQSFLRRTLPIVAPLYTRGFAVLVGIVTLLGVYLVSRQSSTFFGTFPYFFTLGGAGLYLLTIVVVKALHELGHAYTATRYGCRVPTIGVAFLVMVPMLYSDVTDSWTLRDRRRRMAIGAAGVGVELVLAGFASFLWAFLPDGGARSVAFLIATTSWIASVAINLSPFMRFDGYFLLSDYLGVPNLQPRAFALGRWWLRECLFDLDEPPPDRFSAAMRTGLIAYAIAVWIYRLVVFFGIALLVYHYCFKLLGIILFGVEIGWFILKPIVAELKVWWAMRHVILARPRRYLTFGLAGLALAVVVLPWSGRIELPAVVEPARLVRLYPTAPAEITAVSVTSGQRVASGDVLVTMRSPKVEHDRHAAEIERSSLLKRLGRRSAEKRDRSESLQLESELALVQDKFEGLTRAADQLVIRAPFDGVVLDLNRDLTAGRWIARDEEIADVVAPGGLVARGYIAQDDLARIEVGDVGRFVFEDNGAGSVEVIVDQIAYAGATRVEIPYLASTFGGAVAVREGPDHSLIPEAGIHVVTMRLADSDRLSAARGTVVVDGTRVSMLTQAWRRVMRVLIRESGV